MGKPTDIRIVETSVTLEPCPFRTPLKFGGRITTETELINATVRVRTASGREAVGSGSMPLGNVWAWPSPKVDVSTTAEAMRRTARRVAVEAMSLDGFAHPLDHMHHLIARYRRIGDEITAELRAAEPISMLAILVAASPIDAAIHDAFGKANEINSFNGLSSDYVTHDLSHYLSSEFAGEFLDQYTSRTPKARMPLYHLVGAVDPLTSGDIAKPIGDGLPETLEEWVPFNGLTHFKIKLNGDDLRWDVDRVVATEKVCAIAQAKRGCDQWFYSLDFNEKCSGVEYVLDFLKQIQELSPVAFDRVQYIEQPTHRDLAAHPDCLMHEAAKIKPVVIDESLIDFESLLLARRQGYSGVALKACKGHTEALLMAAAAQKFGMFLCVQDLTCPGASFLHSAELSARIPTVAAIEGNGRQYCPGANDPWRDKYPSMFDIKDGTVGTGVLSKNGLGH